MARRKKILDLPKLNDCGGEVTKSKQWFVEYQFRDEKRDKLVRTRIYTGLNFFEATKKETREKRYQAAKQIIELYTDKLNTGWRPTDDSSVVYEDEIEYHQVARDYGRRKQSNITIHFLLSDYLREIKSKVKPKTFESHVSKTRRFSHWLDVIGHADNDIAALTADVVDKFFDRLIDDDKLAGRTVEKYGQNLRAFFNWAIKGKYIKTNPITEIRTAPNDIDHAARPIIPIDIEKFKDAIRENDPQLWLAMQMEFYCFIRPGTELRLMQIGWINFFTNTITIPESMAKNGEKETIVIPKQFAAVLQHNYQLQNYGKGLYIFGNKGVPGPVPYGKNTLRNRFNRYRDELGLSTDYKFYSWKHTGAMLASNAGVPIKDIQMQMRHSSLEITDRYMRNMIGINSDALKNKFPTI